MAKHTLAKTTLAVFVCVIGTGLFLSPLSAANIPVTLEIPVPGQPVIWVCLGDFCSGIATYIKSIYRFAVGFAVMCAVIAISWGGVRWLLSGGESGKIEEAKKIIGNALVGLLLALGSYVFLATIGPQFVAFKPIKVPSIARVELELPAGYAAALPDESSTSTYDPSRRTETGTWAEVSGVHIWISDTFKSGDLADVIYYFHGDLKGYPDPERPGQQTTWSYMRYEAPDIIGKKIKNGMGPVVLAMPYDDVAFTTLKSTVKTYLTSKGIGVSGESLLGHSSGGSKIATILRRGGTFKSIGLIDPSAAYLTDDLVNRYKDKMFMIYNPRNWNGRYAGNRGELRRVAKKLVDRAQLIETNHSDMILEYLNVINQSYE